MLSVEFLWDTVGQFWPKPVTFDRTLKKSVRKTLVWKGRFPISSKLLWLRWPAFRVSEGLANATTNGLERVENRRLSECHTKSDGFGLILVHSSNESHLFQTSIFHSFQTVCGCVGESLGHSEDPPTQQQQCGGNGKPTFPNECVSDWLFQSPIKRNRFWSQNCPTCLRKTRHSTH